LLFVLANDRVPYIKSSTYSTEPRKRQAAGSSSLWQEGGNALSFGIMRLSNGSRLSWLINRGPTHNDDAVSSSKGKRVRQRVNESLLLLYRLV
jgi:hypothetical protein